MTLDQAEALAREQLSGNASADNELKILLRADKLARFVVDVLPVVRAADDCLPQPPPSRRYAVLADVTDHACSVCAPGNDFPNKTWRCARHELIHAIDTMRLALETK